MDAWSFGCSGFLTGAFCGIRGERLFGLKSFGVFKTIALSERNQQEVSESLLILANCVCVCVCERKEGDPRECQMLRDPPEHVRTRAAGGGAWVRLTDVALTSDAHTWKGP